MPSVLRQARNKYGLMILLMHWNARSLLANGQEFKIYRRAIANPMLFVFRRHHLDFRLGGYECVRCDRREGVGGGGVTFIREDITFREIGIGNEHEYIVIEVLTKEGELIIINYYNLCKKLDLNGLMQIEGINGNKRVI